MYVPPIVVIRRPPEKTEKKTGLGVCSDKIEYAINESGLSYDELLFSIEGGKKYLSTAMNGVIRPVFKSKELNNIHKIFHATDEIGMIVFPFVKGKKVVTFHHVLNNQDNTSFLYSWFWKIITNIGMRSTDHIIAISSQTKNELVNLLGIPVKKITVMTTPIGEQYRNATLQKKEKIICAVGEMTLRKNMSSAIRTFKMVLDMPGTSDFKLKICGKGPERENILNIAKELGIENKVELVSNLSEKELVDFYSRAYVLSNPSMHEGLGLATLEAQACSTPVVIFSDAEMPKEVTKFAIPSNTEEDFAKNIHRLIVDESFRSKTISNGLEYARLFGNDFKDKLLAVYQYLDKDLIDSQDVIY